MRIAILADALDFQDAGIHYYLKGLLSAMSGDLQGHEVLLVRPGGADKFPGFGELLVPGSRWGSPSGLGRVLFQIPALLRKENVDLVVEPAHFGPFNLPPHIRRVTVIHDLTPVMFPGYHPLHSVLAHRLLLPRILRKADQVIVNSDNTGRDLATYYPLAAHKITKVSPVKDPLFFPRENEETLSKYGISAPFILTVGTIEPRKNLGFMLEAFELLREHHAHALQWVIAGGPGWKNRSFYDKLEKSPFRKDVILTGYVDRQDLPLLYSCCEAFVYPSHYEGFGLPALEAMACGAPVFLARSSSLPEVGGDAAFYFDAAGGPADLARQLGLLLNDRSLWLLQRQKSLGQAASFSAENACRQFFQAISKAIGNHNETTH
jgi:glycosyltransferase involved in cell wall biosynthesis